MNDTVERWQQIKQILGAALELAPAERQSYLRSVCADDLLRVEIESLLDEAVAADTDFFERGAGEVAVAEIAAAPAKNRLTGRMIGSYRLLEELGAGGMGVVYLAERADRAFEQRVAVKLLRRGLDTQVAVRRFELERRILAKLNHPNIARLLDGGATEDAVPYLVMEYVEGVSLTEYCWQKDLPVRERIELFQAICGAVAFAHRNLIVHRDLKPDNILVTADAVPKLLDFGIAKLLSNDTIKATVTRWQVLTPEYASPEQLQGGTITTQSDVYCLGVILYELLTGAHPQQFKAESRAEMLRRIAEVAPTRPSAIVSRNSVRAAQSTVSNANKNRSIKTSQLKGDLDNIVLKALSKEPERRYASVAEFCADLRRYLEGLPVAARKPTFFYRAAKFVRRNQLPVFAAALVLISAAAGFWATLRQAERAERERQRAERSAANLRKISNTLVSDVHEAIRDLPGSLRARELLLDGAVEQLALLNQDALQDAALQDELAKAYFNVGEMHQALGDVAAAERAHERARQIYQTLLETEPNNFKYRAALGRAFDFLGNIAYLRGETKHSAERRAQAVPLLAAAVRAEPQNPKFREDLWASMHSQAIALVLLGNAAESLEVSGRLLGVAEDARKLDENNLNCRRAPFLTRSMMATAQVYLGDYSRATENLRIAIAGIEAERERAPIGDTRYRYDLFALNRRLAIALENTNDLAGATERLEISLGFIEGLAKDSPKDAGHKRNSALVLLTLGKNLIRRSLRDQALTHLRRAAELSENLLAADPNNGETIADLSAIYAALGAALAFDKPAQGLAVQHKALRLFEQSAVKNNENAFIKRDYAEALAQTAQTELHATEIAGADQTASRRRAVALLEQSLRLWHELRDSQTLSFADRDQPQTIQNLIERLR